MSGPARRSPRGGGSAGNLPFEVLVDAEGSGDSTIDDSELARQVRSEFQRELAEPAVAEPKAADFDELEQLLSAPSPADKRPVKPKRPEPLDASHPRGDPAELTREATGLASTLIRPERWDGEAPTALELLGDDLGPQAARASRPSKPGELPVLDPGLLH